MHLEVEGPPQPVYTGRLDGDLLVSRTPAPQRKTTHSHTQTLLSDWL